MANDFHKKLTKLRSEASIFQKVAALKGNEEIDWWVRDTSKDKEPLPKIIFDRLEALEREVSEIKNAR